MDVKISYQGILAEKTKVHSESLLETGSFSEVLEKIIKMHPALKDLNFVVAINGVISHGKAQIKGGDHVTLIPPAPGG